MREIEALQGIPDSDFAFSKVEPVVKSRLDKMKAARLVPSPSSGWRAA
ncbi:MAG: hypothetical protein ACJ76Z_10260 [Thermoleophilaceae bacterium]